VLQCVAVCCRVMQCVAVCCSVTIGTPAYNKSNVVVSNIWCTSYYNIYNEQID